MHISRTAIWITVLVTAIVVGGFVSVYSDVRPIRIGVLHSTTGTMAVSEKPLLDSIEMAVDEINEGGGVLGRKVEIVVADGKSDPQVAAREAERLITQDKVSVVFGCWTSSCRRTVKPIFEKYNHLLFYPVQYEGIEQSPNIIYTGAAPNQQIIPALRWAFGVLGRKVFLVGSDYVFPRTGNEIIKDYVKKWRGRVVGEEYIPLGSADVRSAVEKIQRTHPSVILNTINGDANLAFFKALRAAGITPALVPTISFSIAEQELQSFDPELLVGDYAAWNYFQSVGGLNTDFVKRFKQRYGEDRVTDDPIEASYFGVQMWADAVRSAGTDQTAAVREALKNRTYRAPGGIVYIDGDTQHTWKTILIGKILGDGQFEVVWSSNRPVRPIPYPDTRTPQQWNTFLNALYTSWGNQWVNPGKSRSGK